MKYENSNRVFILNKHGRALMPCQPRKARLLLKEHRAKVIKRYPFTELYDTVKYDPNKTERISLTRDELRKLNEQANI